MTREASRCTAFRSPENLGVEGGILGGRQVRSMGEGRSGIFVTVDTCLGSRGAQSCALLLDLLGMPRATVREDMSMQEDAAAS